MVNTDCTDSRILIDLLLLMKLACINCRSLFGNFLAFHDYFAGQDFSVIGVVETWLNQNIANDLLQLDDMVLVRKDRLGRGGGVCFYLKKLVKYKQVNLNLDIKTFEYLIVSINAGCETTIVLCLIYRPPSSSVGDFCTEFQDLCSCLITIGDIYICMGDINIDVLNVNSKTVQVYLDIIESFNSVQLISTPTRISRSSCTALDHVIVSDCSLVSDIDIDLDHAIADHAVIKLTISTECNDVLEKCMRYRCMKNFNTDDFLNDLASIDWGLFYDMRNVNDKLSFFNEQLVNVFDRHAPYKVSRVSKKPTPWLTDNLRFMMKLRDKALLRYKRSKMVSHWNYYKSLRNLVNSAVCREKKAYLEHAVKIKGKHILHHLKLLGMRSGGRTERDLPDNLSSPDELNNHFLNVPNRNFICDPEIVNFYNNKCLTNNKLEFTFVSEDEVLAAINSIKSKAVGHDGISLNLINYSIQVTLPLITHIINTCIGHSVLPKSWRLSVVMPLPKKSKPKNFNDIRPISLLPILSKVFEKIIARQLWIHLDKYNILPEYQSGFRAGHGCVTALLHILDDVIKDMDRGMYVALVLLDFSKAFDTISHDLLLLILKYIGLGPSAVELFRQYLADRHQIVRCGDRCSQPGRLSFGVPQGSVLGPILFIIYTSVFVSSIRNSKYHLYADDTQFYYSFKPCDLDDATSRINADLMEFCNFARRHNLILNPEKTKAILFGGCAGVSVREHIRNRLGITLDGQKIEIVESARSLGVVIDSGLRFEEYIVKQIQKSVINLKIIHSVRKIINYKTKILLCEILVLANLNYADSLYGPCLDSHLVRRIQVIQNSCLRLIYGVGRREHVSHKLKTIPWLNMHQRRYLHSACLFHKILLSKTPPYLINKITYRTDVHSINIRRKDQLTIPIHSHTFFQRCFSYNIARVYNELPCELKTLNIRRFKYKLKNKLLNDVD